MSKFFDEVMQLPGRHRTNVFALLAVKLSYYTTALPQDKRIVQSLLDEIKVFFHNHEQRFAILSFSLKQNLSQFETISLPLRLFLIEVIETLELADFKAYFIKEIDIESKLECRLQRIFESQIAVKMLLNPSKRMWSSINEVSKSIIRFLKHNKTNDNLISFLNDLGPLSESSDEPHSALAFGRFAHTPSVDELIVVLKAQKSLATIMLIHFMFMRDAYRYFRLTHYRLAINHGGDFAVYCRTPNSEDPRYFFWNYPEKAPHLYTDRGRGDFDFVISKHLGIALSLEDRVDFPSADTAWFPDCLCQKVNTRSPYVHSLIQNDIPYVAGPSGMTSIFCGAMLFLGQLREMKEQNYYLLAVVAFMVGGGLHSIHEVLTIPNVRLGLLPGYRSFGPDPGNYQNFFTLFHHDDIVANNIRDAWRATIDWIHRQYPHLVGIKATEAPIRIEALIETNTNVM